jgi:hypothetical protein
MNTKNRYALAIGSVVLAGTLAIGTVASAAGNGDGSGGGLGGRGHRPHLTAEQKCTEQEAIGAKVAKVQARVADRLLVLQDKRDAAQTAGDTELVARIDHRIDRLTKVQQRIETRYGKYQVWVTDNC